MMRPAILVACSFLFACTGTAQPPLVASDVLITAPLPGQQMSAGYLTLRNNTPQTIRITRVASPQFEAVEMHESSLNDGVARMRRIEELRIPANAGVRLERGGKHLMLMRPNAELDSVALHFYSGDTVLLSVQTRVAPGNN